MAATPRDKYPDKLLERVATVAQVLVPIVWATGAALVLAAAPLPWYAALGTWLLVGALPAIWLVGWLSEPGRDT